MEDSLLTRHSELVAEVPGSQLSTCVLLIACQRKYSATPLKSFATRRMVGLGAGMRKTNTCAEQAGSNDSNLGRPQDHDRGVNGV